MTDHKISIIELTQGFGSHNLYEVGFTTENKSGMFYCWTEECDKLYDRNVEWDKIFKTRDPIIFETSLKVTGIQKVKSIDDKDQSDYYEIPEREATGYIIPEYDFLNHKLKKLGFYSVKDTELAYSEALNLLELTPDSKITVAKYAEIGNYRNTLFEQIKRQANAVYNINKVIADVFKVYYFESEKAVILAKLNEDSEEKLIQIDLDWREIKNNLSEHFGRRVQMGMSLEDIKESFESAFKLAETTGFHYPESKYFEKNKIKYISKEIHESVMGGYRALMKEKEPLMEKAATIYRKISPLESLLEDFLFENKIKTSEEFSKKLFSIEQFREKVSKVVGLQYWETAHQMHPDEGVWEEIHEKIEKRRESFGLERKHTSFGGFKNAKKDVMDKLKEKRKKER